MVKVRIKLASSNVESINEVVNQLKALADTLGMKIRGPIPLPRESFTITVRRTPCGDGSDTYERWEKRISKRIMDIETDEKKVKQLLRIKVPDDVIVKIQILQ